MNKYITLLQLAELHELIAENGGIEGAINSLEELDCIIWQSTEPDPSSYYEEDFHSCTPVWEAQIESDRVRVLISFLEIMLPGGQREKTIRTTW